MLGTIVPNAGIPFQSTGSGNVVTYEIQYADETAVTDATKVGVAAFDSASFSVDANGFVTLAGGGVATTNINVDASTAPGTDPVVPDGAGNIAITGGQVASGVVGANVIRTNSTAANSLAIEIQRTTAAAGTNINQNGVAHFNSSDFSVDANGFVSLSGSGNAVDSIGVQTGTNPITPTAAGLVTINGAVVAAGTNPVRSDGTGANTMAIEVQISQALAATDATKIGLCNFDSADFGVDANGFVTLAGGGAGQTITGDTGGALAPTAGNWDIVSTSTNGIETTGSGSTLTVAMASPYGDGSFAFTRSASGATNTLTIENTSNTASSNALQQVSVGGTSAGDAFTTYTVTGTTNWSQGIDNSDSDTFVLAASTGLGTSNVLRATTAGNIQQTQVGTSTALSYNCRNTDTNAASTANVQAAVVAGSAADAYLQVAVESTSNYAIGIDNSDSDKLKICFDAAATTPSGATNLLSMTSAGEMTLPLQPAFLAYLASSDLDKTGAGGVFALGSATALTEVFDQNSDFNTNGTFTAPVTGKYRFDCKMNVGDLTAGMNNVAFSLVSSNRTYSGTKLHPGTCRDNNNTVSFEISCLADMDSADTVTLSVTVSGGAGNTADIAGSATVLTFMSGNLVC